MYHGKNITKFWFEFITVFDKSGENEIGVVGELSFFESQKSRAVFGWILYRRCVVTMMDEAAFFIDKNFTHTCFFSFNDAY